MPQKVREPCSAHAVLSRFGSCYQAALCSKQLCASMQPQEHVLGLAGHVPSLPLIPRELCMTLDTHVFSMRETGDPRSGFPVLQAQAVPLKDFLVSL